MCLVNRKDATKTDKCVKTATDDGFKIEIKSSVWERGFLLRFCLKSAGGIIKEEDFVNNYRANVIAIPNHTKGYQKNWSNVFMSDFNRDDLSTDGKGRCRMTNFMPPNLSGFRELLIEPRRTIQMNSDTEQVYEATIDVVPELNRSKYGGYQYIFGLFFLFFWLLYHPGCYYCNRKIAKAIDEDEKSIKGGNKSCFETHWCYKCSCIKACY